MMSALLVLLFLTLTRAEDITEKVLNNATFIVPTILPNGSVVVAPGPQDVMQAGPKTKCREDKFCYEMIPAAMGAYAKGVMNTQVASAIFFGEGNSKGFGVALVNQQFSAKPTFPENTYGRSTQSVSNGSKLVEVYRFDREAAEIQTADGMYAVTDLKTKPILGLYSPLFLPQDQRNYSIVIINLPKDTKNYTLTFQLPDKTNKTYVFQREDTFGDYFRGSQDIVFEAPDITSITSTVEPSTTSGACRVFPFGILLMPFLMLAH